MDQEFKEKCLQERQVSISPTVLVLEQEEEMHLLANRHKTSAEYFLRGAISLLNSATPLLAILVGYFAAEHKANQLLALKGYKVESHICTQMGLSRIAGRKDLAQRLSRIFESRQIVGYRLFFHHTDEDIKTAKDAVDEIISFIEDIDSQLQNKKFI